MAATATWRWQKPSSAASVPCLLPCLCAHQSWRLPRSRPLSGDLVAARCWCRRHDRAPTILTQMRATVLERRRALVRPHTGLGGHHEQFRCATAPHLEAVPTPLPWAPLPSVPPRSVCGAPAALAADAVSAGRGGTRR